MSKEGRRYVRSTENFMIFLGGRRKIKCRESSETRFGKVSRRSEPSSRGKRPFKVSEKFDPENFKRPKNREDSSDLDENLTESIAAMKTIISKIFFRRFRPKTLRKLRETVVDGVGGMRGAPKLMLMT